MRATNGHLGPPPAGPTDALLLTGDAEARLRDLPDRSVNAIVTSPPYFNLRKGAPGGVGNEPTPDDYIARLVSIFHEAHRVLRDDGSCWIVIGDSYARDAGKGKHTTANTGKQAYLFADDADMQASMAIDTKRAGLKEKELIGIPWRLAFALSDDGWYRRHVLVWQKPNPLVESIRDRCTMSHEYVLHMTKKPHYFHDWFAIAEPVASSSLQRIAQATFSTQSGGDKDYRDGTNVNRSARKTLENYAKGDSSVRNARSVWTINVEPSYVRHTSMFPTRLASRIIRAATPDGCCASCGAPMLRVLAEGEPDEAWKKACGADLSGGYAGISTKAYGVEKAQDASATKARILAGMKRRTTAGWKRACKCPDDGAAPLPAVVLDPFAGASTTGLSAARLGRDYVGIEINPDYHALAEGRLRDANAKCLDGDGTRLTFRAVRIQRA